MRQCACSVFVSETRCHAALLVIAQRLLPYTARGSSIQTLRKHSREYSGLRGATTPQKSPTAPSQQQHRKQYERHAQTMRSLAVQH